MWLFTLPALACILFNNVVCISFETDQQRLANALFANYDKTLRPVVNISDCINVTLHPSLFSIDSTDEASESITIVQWFKMTWKDVFMQWNPSDYGGIQQLMVPISRIWYPDICFLNMINIAITIPDEKNFIYIDYDGTVDATFNEVLTMYCKFDIKLFPFDIQNCTMIITSWSFDAAQIDIFFTTPTDLSSYIQNSEWTLMSMLARRSKDHYEGYSTPFVSVYYDIVIQRKPTYYLLTFVLPCFMITTISIIGIFAPFNDAGDREEKVTLGLTTLLTMTVVVTLIAGQMPKTAEGMPLLGTYIMLQIGIAAVTSLIAVLVMYQHRKWTFGEPVPAWILTVTRLPTHNKECNPSVKNPNKTSEKTNVDNTSLNDTKQESIILMNIQSMIQHAVNRLDEHDDQEKLRKNWQRASQRLDLLLMIVFLILNIISTAAFLIIGNSNLQI